MSKIKNRKYILNIEYKWSRCILLQDILVKGKDASKPSKDKGAQDEVGTTYEEVKKDLNALTREEQMDVVYRRALYSFLAIFLLI